MSSPIHDMTAGCCGPGFHQPAAPSPQSMHAAASTESLSCISPLSSSETLRSSSPSMCRADALKQRLAKGLPPWELSVKETNLTPQFAISGTRQLMYPAPVHTGFQPQNEPALSHDMGETALQQETREGENSSSPLAPESTASTAFSGVDSVDLTLRKPPEGWIPAHEVYSDSAEVPQPHRHATDLHFESRFESGNLASAVRVSAFEYNLFLRADRGTGGCQWYYFMVSNMKADARYKFNIMHFYKEKSLYRHGLRPLFWSQHECKSNQLGWRRAGAEICYFENGVKRKNSGRNFTLSFEMDFPHDDDICFLAMCYPFTYSDLRALLLETQLLTTKSRIFTCAELCKTEAGNSCELVTICAPRPSTQIEKRPVFFITGRVHPGESNSSYIVKGIIQFLVSDHPIASALREHFVFEIVPMLNPDGVIHGHYRVSQSGDDLNRNWTDPSRERHPTIYHAKKRIKTLAPEGRLQFYCDIHGHSTKKNIFMYGCNCTTFGNTLFGVLNREERELKREQNFPKLFSERCRAMSYKDCIFDIDKNKENCARAAVARECVLIHCFTLEGTNS